MRCMALINNLIQSGKLIFNFFRSGALKTDIKTR